MHRLVYRAEGPQPKGNTAMRRSAVAAVVLGLIGLVSPVVAANPTGTWQSTTTLGNQALESILKLRLDSEGPTLTGAFIRGSVSDAVPIASTQYKDGQISFSVRCEIDRQWVTIKYSGTLHSDTITGKSQIEQGGQAYSGEWIAKRQK